MVTCSQLKAGRFLSVGKIKRFIQYDDFTSSFRIHDACLECVSVETSLFFWALMRENVTNLQSQMDFAPNQLLCLALPGLFHSIITDDFLTRGLLFGGITNAAEQIEHENLSCLQYARWFATKQPVVPLALVAPGKSRNEMECACYRKQAMIKG